MTVTYCDITGDEIANGTTSTAWRARNRRFYQVMGRDISGSGNRKLDDEVTKIMSQKTRFSFMEYKETYAKKLQEMTE